MAARWTKEVDVQAKSVHAMVRHVQMDESSLHGCRRTRHASDCHRIAGARCSKWILHRHDRRRVRVPPPYSITRSIVTSVRRVWRHRRSSTVAPLGRPLDFGRRKHPSGRIILNPIQINLIGHTSTPIEPTNSDHDRHSRRGESHGTVAVLDGRRFRSWHQPWWREGRARRLAAERLWRSAHASMRREGAKRMPRGCGWIERGGTCP